MSTLFESTTLFITNPDLVEQNLGAETIIYNPLDARAHCLDAVSTKIFCYCKQPRTLDEVAVETGLPSHDASTRVSELFSLGILGAPVPEDNEQSRRSFLKTFASTAAAATVLSVIVPAPSSAASCAANDCSGGSVRPLCSSCNPPGCTNIFVRAWTPFLNQLTDSQGGVFCASLGNNGNATCGEGLPHHVNSNCNTAKTNAEALAAPSPNFRYYCCSNTAATCISLGQCQSNQPAAVGRPCCRGGNCTNLGTCV